MTTTTIERTSVRFDLSAEQRDLLARLDDLTPAQLRDVLCYLIGSRPDATAEAVGYVQAQAGQSLA